MKEKEIREQIKRQLLLSYALNPTEEKIILLKRL